MTQNVFITAEPKKLTENKNSWNDSKLIYCLYKKILENECLWQMSVLGIVRKVLDIFDVKKSTSMLLSVARPWRLAQGQIVK